MSRITKEEAYKLKKLFLKQTQPIEKKSKNNLSSRLPSLPRYEVLSPIQPMRQCVTKSIKELLNANIYKYVEGILYQEDCQKKKVKKIVRFMV